MGYEIDIRKEGPKILDVKYTLRATSDFIGEQKAANKRVSESHKQILTLEWAKVEVSAHTKVVVISHSRDIHYCFLDKFNSFN